MLMVSELAELPTQEAAMSTISTFPRAAGQAAKALRRDSMVPHNSSPSDKPERSDADMMYAWSIGVTGTVRALDSQHEEVREECPPEVYIG